MRAHLIVRTTLVADRGITKGCNEEMSKRGKSESEQYKAEYVITDHIPDIARPYPKGKCDM